MTSAPNSDSPEGPPPGQSFFDWLRGLGITLSTDRWLGGVAAGLAKRLSVDPAIVRGVFVVLALLGGPGVLIYLVGWLLLPDASGRIHAEEIFRGRASAGLITTAAILAALVVIPALLGLIIPGASFPGFSVWSWGFWPALGIPGWVTGTIAGISWVAIIVLGGIWLQRLLLRRGRAEHDRADATNVSGDAEHSDSGRAPRSFVNSTDAFAARTAYTAKRDAAEAADWAQRAGDAADRWSRDLGRQADEWSARYAERHDARRLGVAHIVITLALALLAGGIAALWSGTVAAQIPYGGAAPIAVIAGIIGALVVLACSLIVAGVRGRHTSWIGFLAFCGVFALVVSVVLPWGSRLQLFGNMHVEAGTAPGAALVAGSVDVDLSNIGSSAAGDDLEVWLVAGRTTVELPQGEPTIVRVRVLAGRVDDSGRSANDDGERYATTVGPFLWREIRSQVTPENAAEAHVVTVTVVAGTVDVTGGGSSTSPSNPRTSSTNRTDQSAPEDRTTGLQQRLDEVNWRLDKPGLDRSDRASLIADRADIQRQLDDLELENAR